jgi:hypothetical protein
MGVCDGFLWGRKSRKMGQAEKVVGLRTEKSQTKTSMTSPDVRTCRISYGKRCELYTDSKLLLKCTTLLYSS